MTKFENKIDHNFFSDWLAEKGLPLEFEDLSDQELALILRRFYAEVQQKNGKKYSRSGLKNLRGSIQRHLTLRNRSINILTDKIFQPANTIFLAQVRTL